MEYAKQMLTISTLSIEEIAFKCGFSGLTVFSRKFKQELGYGPLEYRKNLLTNNMELWNWKLPLNEIHFNQLIQLKNNNCWLAKLMIVVIENIDNEYLSVEELAQKTFMSSSNLNRKILQLFGFSTMKLVRNLRLQHAIELIVIQNKSVTEAASLSGFFDASHLSHYFKKYLGCSSGVLKNKSEVYCYITKLKDELLMS